MTSRVEKYGAGRRGLKIAVAKAGDAVQWRGRSRVKG